MDREGKKFWIYFFISVVIIILGVIALQHTDWQYVCTSPLRFLKPYTLNCVMRGYSLFP